MKVKVQKSIFLKGGLPTQSLLSLKKLLGIVPIYIERIESVNFKIKVFEPIRFKENQNIEEITIILNNWLEKVISLNPSKWIWTHDRWK